MQHLARPAPAAHLCGTVDRLLLHVLACTAIRSQRLSAICRLKKSAAMSPSGGMRLCASQSNAHTGKGCSGAFQPNWLQRQGP